MSVVHLRSKESQETAIVNTTGEFQENETSCTVNNSSQIEQVTSQSVVDKQHSDTASESYVPPSGRQVVTDRKPPLQRRDKTQQSNVKSSSYVSTAHIPTSGSGLVFTNKVAEALTSPEPMRRKLRLPWKRKKKKRYMPGEETSRWRWNFESWRSASQLSLDIDSETENAADKIVWRATSHSDLENVDTASIGSNDYDTDTMSDDPLAGSLNERGTHC